MALLKKGSVWSPGVNSLGGSHAGAGRSYLLCRASAEPAPSCWVNSLADHSKGSSDKGDRKGPGLGGATRAIQQVYGLSFFSKCVVSWHDYFIWMDMFVCLFWSRSFSSYLLLLLYSLLHISRVCLQMVRDAILFWKWAAGEYILGIYYPGLSVCCLFERKSPRSFNREDEYLTVILSMYGDNH